MRGREGRINARDAGRPGSSMHGSSGFCGGYYLGMPPHPAEQCRSSGPATVGLGQYSFLRHNLSTDSTSSTPCYFCDVGTPISRNCVLFSRYCAPVGVGLVWPSARTRQDRRGWAARVASRAAGEGPRPRPPSAEGLRLQPLDGSPSAAGARRQAVDGTSGHRCRTLSRIARMLNAEQGRTGIGRFRSAVAALSSLPYRKRGAP